MPEPPTGYPPYVSSADDQRRWRLCAAIAAQIFDDEVNRWMATRALYRGPLPTDDPDPEAANNLANRQHLAG